MLNMSMDTTTSAWGPPRRGGPSILMKAVLTIRSRRAASPPLNCVMHPSRPTSFLLLVALCAISAPSLAECPEYLAGQTFDWATAVCEVKNETDDYLSPSVQACVKQLVARDKIGKTPFQDCRLNAFYKKEWCSYYAKLGNEKSVSSCVKSKSSIPEEVAQGIGG